MSLSTHVLDAATGRPAAGLPVRLEAADGTVLAEHRTDADGRIRDLPAPGAGTHRLIFDTGEISPFYPSVTIAFTVTDPAEHYHVPLLLSPYSFSTYRGS
ncbi:hydroxyisourate hydrolase [Nocardia sp. CC227C]|uniref:hydroxyisourate hydrolase n=1 Tax=Nocardia sp. CC227C TaxID=3044562 RepID=UPI00278BCA9F|nr:hydroxyisourate hydrolase [Nocardia sp. CC227C]